MSWVSISAWMAGEPRIFGRMLLAIIAVYFVLGLTFRSAIAVNALGLAAYVAIANLKGMPAIDLTHYLLTLGIANVICIAGAWNLEHARRTAWLEGQRLAETAMQDGLTGIHNRRRFDEHLQRAWAQSIRDRKPIALLLADIDHFKPYNDRYGHQAGDEAMKRVASTLAHFARRPLDLAARYGGEEFAIILFDTKRADAEHLGAEILEAVQKLAIPHQDSGAAPVLTISIGIACVVPAARRSWAGLVQLADQALYAAKDGGRNRLEVLEQEYEHMQTGYFHRKAAAKTEPEGAGLVDRDLAAAAGIARAPEHPLGVELERERAVLVDDDDAAVAADAAPACRGSRRGRPRAALTPERRTRAQISWATTARMKYSPLPVADTAQVALSA